MEIYSMLRIGLTGGIGSGKTTAAKIFELLGVPVYYADEAARRVMNSNEDLKAAIQKQFGQESYINGELNRPYLASRVFSNKYQLEILNSLVHPVTISDANDWMQRQQSSYAIKEAALMFESAAAEHLDYVIGVSAPYELRIKRAVERDHVEAGEIIKRMNRQIDENIKMKLCDFILKNDEQQLLIPQVISLHEKLLEMAKKKASA